MAPFGVNVFFTFAAGFTGGVGLSGFVGFLPPPNKAAISDTKAALSLPDARGDLGEGTNGDLGVEASGDLGVGAGGGVCGGLSSSSCDTEGVRHGLAWALGRIGGGSRACRLG